MARASKVWLLLIAAIVLAVSLGTYEQAEPVFAVREGMAPREPGSRPALRSTGSAGVISVVDVASGRRGQYMPVTERAAPARTMKGMLAPISKEGSARVEAFRQELALQHDDEAVNLMTLREERADPAWSPDAEIMLRRGFSGRATRLAKLSAAEPVCVTSLCAVAAEGGTDSAELGADFQEELGQMSREPWFKAQFADVVLSTTVKDGRIVYSAYLIRKQN